MLIDRNPQGSRCDEGAEGQEAKGGGDGLVPASSRLRPIIGASFAAEQRDYPGLSRIIR